MGPAPERIPDFAAALEAAEDGAAILAIRRSRFTGRPVGSADGIRALEAGSGRALAPGKRGPRRAIYFIQCHRDTAGHTPTSYLNCAMATADATRRHALIIPNTAGLDRKSVV